MNTTKNNKLIAEFMGIESFKDSLASLHNGKINVSIDIYEQAKYHTSWDWLMPVVERCYDNGAEGEEIGDITHALLDCDIKSTYQAVVQFINQYNNQ